MRLLSPKPFQYYSLEEFLAYVRTLYIEPEKAAPPAEWSVRLNAKNNPVITVRRKPKWLRPEEVRKIAEVIGWEFQKTWIHVLKKKIEIRVPNLRKKK